VAKIDIKQANYIAKIIATINPTMTNAESIVKSTQKIKSNSH